MPATHFLQEGFFVYLCFNLLRYSQTVVLLMIIWFIRAEDPLWCREGSWKALQSRDAHFQNDCMTLKRGSPGAYVALHAFYIVSNALFWWRFRHSLIYFCYSLLDSSPLSEWIYPTRHSPFDRGSEIPTILTSLSEKTRKSYNLLMWMQKQPFLLNYYKTLSFDQDFNPGLPAWKKKFMTENSHTGIKAFTPNNKNLKRCMYHRKNVS